MAAPAHPMIFWAQLLHFYQPPTQSHEVLRRVAQECYRPLLDVLLRHPSARVAVNINACLAELLHEHGLGDVLRSLRELAGRGQVEFTGSGRFHPILPLIPEGERVRSIAENARVNRELLGPAWQPRGFFPPEMACDPQSLPAIAASGHTWLALSGTACPGTLPTSIVPRLEADGHSIAALFRDEGRSNAIAFRKTKAEAFVEDLTRLAANGARQYVFTAMDAETFGHHLPGWEETFLARAYGLIEAQQGTGSVSMATPGDVCDLFEPGPAIKPLASSWSTSARDLALDNAYPLWQSPDNEVHRLQWDHLGHCLRLVEAADRHGGRGEARKSAALASERMGAALHSCQFWWASRRPMWNVEMIQRGLALQVDALACAMRSVRLSNAPQRAKDDAWACFVAARAVRSSLEDLLYGPA